MNQAAIPAPRYVGWRTTRASIASRRFTVRSAWLDQRPESRKNRLRSRSETGGVVKTQIPIGTSPCHRRQTWRTNPT